MPEIVKSCDILILDSSDYMDRVWCYTELFVWLTKLVEIESQLFGERIFGSVVSRRTPDERAAFPFKVSPLAPEKLANV